MAIVVGYVPTKEGSAALTWATQECLLRTTNLIIVNTQHGEDAFTRKESARFEEEVREVGATLEAAGLGCEVRQLVDDADASEVLVALAEKEQADFIVIGLRRRTQVGKLILGSNAQRILLDATRPVMAVKAQD